MLAASQADKLAGLYQLLLLIAGVLLAVFVVTVVLVRAMRRYRQTQLRAPHKATVSDDLWRQHRLPDEQDDAARSDESS